MCEWTSEEASVLASSSVSVLLMWRSARRWKWADLQTLETWCLKVGLLSRVTRRVVTLTVGHSSSYTWHCWTCRAELFLIC